MYCAPVRNVRLPPIAIDVPGVPLPGVNVPLIVLLAPETVPAQLREPKVLLKPFKSSVAPEATAKAVLAPNAFAVPARNVPPFTLVALV